MPGHPGSPPACRYPRPVRRVLCGRCGGRRWHHQRITHKEKAARRRWDRTASGLILFINQESHFPVFVMVDVTSQPKTWMQYSYAPLIGWGYASNAYPNPEKCDSSLCRTQNTGERCRQETAKQSRAKAPSHSSNISPAAVMIRFRFNVHHSFRGFMLSDYSSRWR